jgi:RNA polymerase sigma-70 factor (ECF subfamily)
MADSVATRPSLLVRIKDQHDRQAWAEFVDLYAPVVHGYAQKHGLQDADAADLTQEVLTSVARAAPRLDYDPARGSFRAWLFTVVRNELRDFLAAQGRSPAGSGDTDMNRRLHLEPAPAEDEAAAWEHEYQRQLFALAAEQVRGDFQDATWQAFWLTAIDGKSGKEAASILGITTAAVYLAKRRVMTRLRQQIEQLQAEER